MTQEKQKVALITGASRGIGKAVALGMAELGYQVVLTARNLSDLERVATEAAAKGGLKPAVFEADITRESDVKQMMAQVLKRYKRIDVLVNNAGIHFGGSVELPLQDFKTMLDTNLTAQLMLLQFVVPVMKEQQSGYIFNVASRSGKVGFAGSGGYCATKFGLVGLNESLYRELTPLGIKVTALCPAWVHTGMAKQAGTPLEPEEMIQPHDLFQTIKWLLTLSPGACVKEVVITNPRSL
ncbi:MAG: SDR family oxidoreductase [Mariniphaga sp.]